MTNGTNEAAASRKVIHVSCSTHGGPAEEDVVDPQAADDHRNGQDRPKPAWYLRSLSDHDTHRGQLNENGTVLAHCGVNFAPRPTWQVTGPPPGQLTAAGPALRGNPPDPDQVCQDCASGADR